MTLDVYSALFDADLDAVAERLGKAAEDSLRTSRLDAMTLRRLKTALTRAISGHPRNGETA
jgi:hypothetical protein